MPRDTWDKERLDVQHTGHSEERPSACAYSGCNSGSWSVNLALRYMTRVSSRIVSFMTPVFFFSFSSSFFLLGVWLAVCPVLSKFGMSGAARRCEKHNYGKLAGLGFFFASAFSNAVGNGFQTPCIQGHGCNCICKLNAAASMHSRVFTSV